jgi:hypothetical protein
MSTLNYLGYEIRKAKDIKGKTVYRTKTSVVPKSTVLQAKKDIITHLIRGKVSVLKIKDIKSKASKINSKTDLNNFVKKLAPVKKGLNGSAKRQSAKSLCRKVVRVEGLKINGQLKKGWKYKGGKPVKVKPIKKKSKKK